MAPDILFYRLYRLRRLIAVSVAVPLAVGVLAGLASGGAGAMVLLALGVLAPVLHAVTYPNAWTETVTVAVVAAVLLGLASTIGTDVGFAGLALRGAGLALLAPVLCLLLASRTAALLMAGEPGPHRARAQARSRLDCESLRKAITLYPGRSDARTTCGPANDKGVFAVITTIEWNGGGLDGEDGAAGDTMQVTYYSVVQSTGPDHHEVISFETRSSPVAVNRHDFAPRKMGCVVRLEERGENLTPGQRLGYWLQDYIGDHLTDEIDRAEGRASRSNRGAGHDQMLVDLALLIARGLSGPPGEDPR